MLSLVEQNSLQQSLQQTRVKLTSHQQQQIEGYLAMLLKWNKTYNLTGFKSFKENLIKNILDCLCVAPYITTQNNLDIGTGAGLPGVLMAIVYPEQTWTLLDSNGKKTRFVDQVKLKLSLNNVTVTNTRLENFRPDQKFQGISTRAFDKIPATLESAKHLMDNVCLFYAMKGKLESESLENLPAWVTKQQVHPIHVPGLEEQRHLLVISCRINQET